MDVRFEDPESGFFLRQAADTSAPRLKEADTSAPRLKEAEVGGGEAEAKGGEAKPGLQFTLLHPRQPATLRDMEFIIQGGGGSAKGGRRGQFSHKAVAGAKRGRQEGSFVITRGFSNCVKGHFTKSDGWGGHLHLF